MWISIIRLRGASPNAHPGPARVAMDPFTFENCTLDPWFLFNYHTSSYILCPLDQFLFQVNHYLYYTMNIILLVLDAKSQARAKKPVQERVSPVVTSVRW